MGSDDLFKKFKAQRELRRRTFVRDPRDRILIVCEGEQTEPQYFEEFRLTNVTVRGTGFNTDSLVQYAIRLRNKAKREKESYDQVWCVFDRDSFPAKNFNDAFILAEQNGIKVAYSNEAFELWYLLHFNYYDTGMSRSNYCVKLNSLLGFKYEKKCPIMYEVLLDKQADAIRNASSLLSQYPSPNPEKDNPSTTIHFLVTELNRWLYQ